MNNNNFKKSWLDNYYPAIGVTQEMNETKYVPLQNLVLPSLYATNKIKNIVGTAGTTQMGGTKHFMVKKRNINDAFIDLEKKMEKNFKGLGDFYLLELKNGKNKFFKIYKKKNI